MKIILNELIEDGNVTETYMEENGRSMFVLSHYEKIPTDIWFYNFNVGELSRGKGFGNETLDFAIDQAKRIAGGKGILRLNVKPESWMEKWYERKGFVKYHSEGGWDYMFMALN
jgi:GNAT superfamily N-acetyltransferase